MIYDELVNALRYCADWNCSEKCPRGKADKDNPCFFSCKDGRGQKGLLYDAAEAIEYLILQNEMAQHAIRGLDATCNGLLKENERLKEGYEAWKRDEEYKAWLYNDRPCPDFAREE